MSLAEESLSSPPLQQRLADTPHAVLPQLVRKLIEVGLSAGDELLPGLDEVIFGDGPVTAWRQNAKLTEPHTGPNAEVYCSPSQ